MTSKVNPYYQHSHYKVDLVSPSYEKISSNEDAIKQSDNNNTIPSSSKPKISLWPAVLWIGLGTLIFIALVMVIVVPIAALANIGDATSNTTTICPTTSITTTITLSSLPAQCSSYTTITDDTRNPTYTPATTSCDDVIFSSTPTWVRFTGSGGALLANCPIEASGCAADAPGWYSGIHPSLAGDTTSGFVCFNFLSDYCYWTILILVTNCNGFYVYYLKQPPACDLRYCTI